MPPCPETGTHEILRAGVVTIAFDPRRIIAILAAVVALLWAVGVTREVVAFSSGNSLVWWPFALDREHSLPTWLSSLLLFAGSLSAFGAALLSRLTGAPGTGGWIALAVASAIMSAEEIVGIHEQTVPLMHALADFTGLLFWSWVVWAIPLVAVVGLALVPFLRRVRRPTAVRLLVAGAVYVSGAIGMEMIGGLAVSTPDLGIAHAVPFCAEEGLEMLGAVLFLRAVLMHIAETSPRVLVAAATGSR